MHLGHEKSWLDRETIARSQQVLPLETSSDLSKLFCSMFEVYKNWIYPGSHAADCIIQICGLRRVHQIGLDGFPTLPHKKMLLGVSQHFRKVQKLHWTIVAGSIYGILPSPQSPAVASTNLPRAHRFPNRWFHARQWAGSPARYCRRKDIGHKG